jgi:L-ascorbate metabolism protein UlaG (beta-lactamase superfamily)
MRITYAGHATVEIEAAGTRLLTDPVLLPRILTLRRIVPPPPRAIRAPDAVLISHAHFDHLDTRSLRLIEPCPVVAPRGCRRLLERAGLREVIEPAPGETVTLGALTVTAALVDHDGRRHPLSRARETFAYLVKGAGTSAFFAGDTDLFDGMREWAGVDVALLPIWGWGPRLGSGHMDPGGAAAAAALIEPRVAIPIHWGTLASRRAPWRGDPRRPARSFVTEMGLRAPGVEVRILEPGEATEVDG